MGALTEVARNPIGPGPTQEEIDRFEQLWGREVVDNPKIGYNHLILTSCFLPRADPGEKSMWQCKDGNLTMVMTRGPAFNPKMEEYELIGYPFGIWPRRFHSILNAEILRNRSRDIYFPDGFCEFFSKRLGDGRHQRALMSGGKTGNIFQMKTQFQRLIAANLVFGIRDTKTVTMVYPARLIETMELWLIGEEERCPRILQASQVYTDSLLEHAVPINLNASACIRSSLEYDLYTWAARRVFSMKVRDERFVKIPWTALHFQFGKGSALRAFKQDFRAAVAHLRGYVYQDLNFREYPNGFELRASPLAVPQRFWGINVEPQQQSFIYDVIENK